MKISEHLAKDMKHHAKKHAEKKAATTGEKKHHSFHVKQAHDGSGYVVETTEEGGNDFRPPSTSVHKSLGSVKRHMEDCCQDNSMDKGDEE